MSCFPKVEHEVFRIYGRVGCKGSEPYISNSKCAAL